MSATTPRLGYPRMAEVSRLRRLVSAGSLPVRAFLASRVIVLAAGIAGALAVPRRLDWPAFDPTGLTTHLGTVGNVLGAAAVRWDSIHYLSIAAHGYARPADAVFFPLYPLLIRGLGFVVVSQPLAGVAISAVSLIVALTMLHRLTRLELGERAANAAVLLVAFAPLSFFFTAVYTESLFLALSLGCVYAARRERWKLAAALGGLAAVTRVTGVVLVVPLAILWIGSTRRPRWALAWILVVPAALAGYLAFNAAKGFGALAPVVQQTGGEHQHLLTGPIDTIALAVKAAYWGLRSLATTAPYQPSLAGPFSGGAQNVLLLAVLVIAVLALVAAFRRLPLAYGAYAAAALLVCISSPVAGQPLKSLDRYTLTIFPLWMAAAAWIAERRLTRTAVLVSAALLAFFTFQFATWAFIA
ncbi:MAG TPA: mannosyltransferase family protein [Solirubrobacteraceae bacterium]|nr:mannosyltransferase family protein [Solirubrobacteraceae bacterium]